MKQKDYNYYTYYVGRYLPYEFMPEESRAKFIPYVEDNSKLVWNVITRGGVYNIFDHYSFCKGLLEVKKKYKDDFIQFAEHVRKELSYDYWCKAEWEILVTDLFPCIDKEQAQKCINEIEEKGSIRAYVPLEADKIDVYTQVMLNWDRFIHYLWDNKRKITKKGLGIK